MGTVTDGLQRSARPQPPVMQPPIALSDGSGGRERTSRQRRHAHPLLGAFPLAVMTLGTFLVLFSLMMARLKASATPALPSSGAAALVARAPGGGAVRTRASGGVAAAAIATPVAAEERSPATTPAIVTRVSGAAGVGGVGDD